jgi:hypothetical protein
MWYYAFMVIYAVIGADGCECDTVEALFPDKESAIAYLKALEGQSDPDIYGDIGYASVKEFLIGERIDCLADNVVYKSQRKSRTELRRLKESGDDR